MPQMFHLALPQHGVGIAAMPWDWAVGPNLGHLLGFFCPATDTFNSEFKPKNLSCKYATAAKFWSNVVAFSVCSYVECTFILVIITFPVEIRY